MLPPPTYTHIHYIKVLIPSVNTEQALKDGGVFQQDDNHHLGVIDGEILG